MHIKSDEISLRDYEGMRRKEHALLNDADEILTFKQWIALNKLSDRTGRRILKAPGGPTVTLLSRRRFGISRRANRDWQASRERA
jgi:hypothetical protein